MSSHEFSLRCQTITRITAAAYGIRLACGKLGAAMRRPAMPPSSSAPSFARSANTTNATDATDAINAAMQRHSAAAAPRLQEA